MKRPLIAALFFAFTTVAQAGIIMEERPVSLSFQPTDKFSINGIIMDERFKTSFGQTLERGTYVLTIEGTGRTNELLISFSTGMGQPPIAKTKATLERRTMMPGGSNPGAARGFQDVDDRPVFSKLGFTTLSHAVSAREGAIRKLTIESTNSALHFAIEAKLVPAVQ